MHKGQNIHFTPGWKFSILSPSRKVRVSQKISSSSEFHLAYVNMPVRIEQTMFDATMKNYIK